MPVFSTYYDAANYNKAVHCFIAPVAQGIEYWPPKPRVARSIRAGRTTIWAQS